MKVRYGPDGAHLFNRVNGTNVLINEIAIPHDRWSLAPRQISVALTNACDLACPYCYAPKHAARLDSEQLACWLQELDRADCLGVGFGGGEPTLHPDFASLCKFVAKETGLAVTFTTHAHHLREPLAARLSGNVHFIRVSMDGVDGTYEALRGKPFNILRDRLHTVRALAPFGINFVVNKSTFDDIDRAIAIAIECGATEFLLLPERRVRAATGVDAKTLNKLRRWAQSFSGSIRLTISEGDTDGFQTSDPLPNEKELRSYAHIDASGILKRSSFDDLGVRIGATVMGALSELKDLTRSTQ